MIHKDKNGKLYKMLYGIEKVYLNDKEIAQYEIMQKTDRATKGRNRKLDPFKGYIEK